MSASGRSNPSSGSGDGWEPPSGLVIQGLEVQELLGRGGMGEVYKAWDPHLARHVAIKLVSAAAAADAQFAARFQREARSASSIQHPNVAQIFAAGTHEGRPYYVMELIEGRSLAELLQERGPLAGRRCLDYLIQACQGLDAAHRAGVVHRDIKPANLMLDATGGLKIVDFGLARQLAGETRLTQSHIVVGTPAYLAPEQALGQEVDHRADIYALGATFYHLFSGHPPFEADTPLGLLMKHARDPLPPLKERNPRVPQSICNIIERMLAKEPDARYADYEELIADLQTARSGAALTVAPPSPPAPSAAGSAASSTRPLARQPVAWVLAALLFLFGVALLMPGGGTDRPAAETEPETDVPGLPPEEGGWRPPRRRPPPPGAQRPPAPRQAEPPGTGPQRLERLTEALGAAPILRTAHNAQAMAQLRRLSTSTEIYRAERGVPPESLDQVAEEQGLNPRELVDTWGTPIRLERQGDLLRLSSAGADGRFGTPDDLVLEDGFVVQDGPGR